MVPSAGGRDARGPVAPWPCCNEDVDMVVAFLVDVLLSSSRLSFSFWGVRRQKKNFDAGPDVDRGMIRVEGDLFQFDIKVRDCDLDFDETDLSSTLSSTLFIKTELRKDRLIFLKKENLVLMNYQLECNLLGYIHSHNRSIYSPQSIRTICPI